MTQMVWRASWVERARPVWPVLGWILALTVLVLGAGLILSQELMPRADDDPTSALSSAARRGDVAGIEHALHRGASVDSADGSGVTPLLEAAMAGKAKAVGCLLQHGADPEKGTPGFGTPLIAAVYQGNSEVVHLLLAHGASPNARVGGMTPLWMGTLGSTGNAPAVRELLESGAAVDARGPDGRTVLASAVAAGRPDLVRLLKEAGAQGDDDATSPESKAAAVLVAAHEPGR